MDTFGNESAAIPAGGKVRVLLSNVETFVHGLGPDDTITYLPRTSNAAPQVTPPPKLLAAVGVPMRYRLDGRDPDGDLQARRQPRWSLTDAPAGMTVRPGSGLVEWTPTQPGHVSVRATLTDADGAAADATLEIDVLAKGANLPPEIVSRPAPAVCVGGEFHYRPAAVDANGDTITWKVDGPAGMAVADGAVAWHAGAVGAFPVKLTADDGKGGQAVQEFELAVCPNPDRPREGVAPPRMPTDLTVVKTGPAGVSLVWSNHSPGQTVVQRASAPAGPWQEVGKTDGTSFVDTPPAGAAFYRVLGRNDGGQSDPSPAVDGRGRPGGLRRAVGAADLTRIGRAGR